MATTVKETEHNTGWISSLSKKPFKTMGAAVGLISIGAAAVAVVFWRLEVLFMVGGIAKEFFMPSNESSVQEMIKTVVQEFGKIVRNGGQDEDVQDAKEAAAHTSTNETEGKAEDHLTSTNKEKEGKAHHLTSTNKEKEGKTERRATWPTVTKAVTRKQKLCGIKQYFAAMFLVVGFSTVMFTSVMVHAFTFGSLTVIPEVLKLLSRGNESRYLAGFKEIADTFVKNVQTGCNCVLNLLTGITGEDVAAKVEYQFGCTMGGAVGGAVGGTLGGLANTFLRVIHPYFGQAVGSALGATLGWTISKTFTTDNLKKQGVKAKIRDDEVAVAGALGGSIGAFFGFLKGGVVGGLAGGVIGMITDTYLQTNQTKQQTHTDKPNQSSTG